MEVDLTVIGASPAWPNPGGANAGYLVRSDKALLLDCGPGVLSALRADDRLPVDAIAITHLHLDHWGDLVPWIWFERSGLIEPRQAELWLPPGTAAELTAVGATFGYGRMFEDGFALNEYEARVPFRAAGFELTAVPVEHFGMTAFGFRVRDGAGRTLAYSGDSAPCPALAELADGADLFLCEATLETSAADSNPRGHLCADEALAVPARRTVLTHRPVELGAPSGVDVAVPGMTISV
jgi:ribonuclease BN (tRNA processing enzyme)